MLAHTFSSVVSAGAPAACAAMLFRSIRSFSSSWCAQQGAPTYTYTPPGSSVQDPSYSHNLAEVGSQPLPEAKIMRPSKKAQWLRVNARRELESQSQKPGAMLPPGCSMSDPHYSIRDPVYFVDKQ